MFSRGAADVFWKRQESKLQLTNVSNCDCYQQDAYLFSSCRKAISVLQVMNQTIIASSA